MSLFVVTTSTQGASRSQIWDAKAPLALGHPFRWIVEKTETGIRVRSLSDQFGKIEKGGHDEISFKNIEKEKEIELPSSGSEAPLSLRIRPVTSILPAFTSTGGDFLTVYVCSGNWVVHSVAVENKFTGITGRAPAFTLKRSGRTMELKCLTDGLSLDGQAVARGNVAPIPLEDLVKSTLSLGRHTWRFTLSSNPPSALPLARDTVVDPDSEYFKKASTLTTLGFLVFLAIAWIWPKPDPTKEELIPPQFAKIVLSSQPKTETKAESSAKENTDPRVTKKIQDTAVVQAFRTQALQNAVTGLLKGGMSKLLSQSDLVQGKTLGVKTLFDAKSQALLNATPAGKIPEKNVQVAALGGGGAQGYTQGERAAVKGQGQGFISTDIGGTTVEEGLTKDEVGEVIHRHMSEVRYCYESAMLRSPNLEGKLIVNFVIGGTGVVKSSEVKSSTLPDPRLDDCILRRLGTWAFPHPKGGIDVAVSYPFIFKTLGR